MAREEKSSAAGAKIETKCQQFLRKEYWTAFEADWDLGRPVGYGLTEADAIADLQDQLDDGRGEGRL